MAQRHAIPDEVRGRAFTVNQALAIGLTRRMLQSTRFVMIHRTVYVEAGLELTLDILVRADLLVLPPGACVSHVTALQWHGVTLGSKSPRHYSTVSSTQTRLAGVVLHRRGGTLSPRLVRGIPVLGPDRTLVDCGTLLSQANLVRAGDMLVRLGLTTPDVLKMYAAERHLDGVVRTRRSTRLVRSKVDSVRETDVRLLLILSGLPEPGVNLVISADGHFLARGDLVYVEFKVVVEYDGWQHERDARQRRKDIHRRERLEAAGWRVIIITADDMRHPASVAGRVWDALTLAGYEGPPPSYNPRDL